LTLTHSILLLGPTGAGKSYFARSALDALGSGLICASPLDELDSYYPLEAPRFVLSAFDDSAYFPSEEVANRGSPTGLTNAVRWLRQRLIEVNDDQKAGRPVRYKVLVLDTVSAFGTLAQNAAMVKYKHEEPPAAMSPDGAAYYTYLRQRQQEFLRTARTFRGFGVHLIALSHVTETDVKDTQVAKTTDGTSRMTMANAPGSFKTELPSYFSTVLVAGVGQRLLPAADAKSQPKQERYHYVQWAADPKRPTKNRFGSLGPKDKLSNDWTTVTTAVEAAAAARLVPTPTER